MTAGSLVLVSVLSAQSAVRHGAEATEALSHGLGFVTFTEAKFAVAGAGLGTKLRIVRFHLQWKGFPRPTESGVRTEASLSQAAARSVEGRVSETKYRETTTTKKVGRYAVPS